MTRKLMKAFFLILMAGILVFSVIPASAEETGSDNEAKQEEDEGELYAVVRTTPVGRINLRADPTAASARVGVIEPGTKAKVLKNLGKWVMIDVDGLVGYMSSFYLDFYMNGKPFELPPVQTRQTASTADSGRTQQTPAHSAHYYEKASWPTVENTVMYVSTANKGKLRLRYQPTTDSAVAGAYALGTEVTVLNRSDTWAYVNVKGNTGFMMLRHLSYTQPEPPTPPKPTPPIGTATVVHPRKSFVNLRSSRTTDTDRNILMRVPHGAVVDILVWDPWYSTVTYNGITGYMVTSYLVR